MRRKIPKDNKLKADSCFQSPTKDEWQYFGAHIFFEDKNVVHYNEIVAFSTVKTNKNGQTFLTTFSTDPFQILSEEISPNSIPDYRCDTLIFNLGEITPTAKFEMKIDALMLVPSESEGCLEYGEQVRELLKQKEIEIEFDCEKTEFASNFVVTKKPDSFSQEEAQNIVSKAYREIRTIEGPWIFSGELADDTTLDSSSTEEAVPSATPEIVISTP